MIDLITQTKKSLITEYKLISKVCVSFELHMCRVVYTSVSLSKDICVSTTYRMCQFNNLSALIKVDIYVISTCIYVKINLYMSRTEKKSKFSRITVSHWVNHFVNCDNLVITVTVITIRSQSQKDF